MTQCLIVDCSRENRIRVGGFLEYFGIDVAQAESGEDALAQCRSEMPDMILLSDSPGTGEPLKFLQRLKVTSRTSDSAPIVLVCADVPDEQSIGAAIWNGASDCLLQPFDQAVLESKLKQFGFA